VVGKFLTEAEYTELVESLDYGKAYSYATYILASRMYTVKEIQDKLRRRDVSEVIIDSVVAKLLETRLLDDEVYAKNFVETSVKQGKKGAKRIRDELKNKGILDEIIVEVLADFDQNQEILKRELEKCWYKYSKFSGYEHKQKVTQALARRGFSFDDISTVYAEFMEDLA